MNEVVNMAGKVKVSREVAKAINEIETWIGVDEDRAEKVLKFAELLAYGHEVERKPEDILRDKYEELFDYEPIDRACKDSFRFVLDTLGIKIKGINE